MRNDGTGSTLSLEAAQYLTDSRALQRALRPEAPDRPGVLTVLTRVTPLNFTRIAKCYRSLCGGDLAQDIQAIAWAARDRSRIELLIGWASLNYEGPRLLKFGRRNSDSRKSPDTTRPSKPSKPVVQRAQPSSEAILEALQGKIEESAERTDPNGVSEQRTRRRRTR